MFSQIELMEGLKWSNMVLRREHDVDPYRMHDRLDLAKNECVIIGTTFFYFQCIVRCT